MRHHDDNTKPSQKAHARRTLTDGWAGLTGVPLAPVVLLLTSILLVASLAFLPNAATARPADGTDGVTTSFVADRKDDGKVDGKAGEETDGKAGGKVAKNRSNDWSDGINIADAAVLTVVFAIVTLAIKSLAKEGARRCGGNCACCGVVCDERGTKRAARDLSKDPVLLAKLEEVKRSVGTK